MSLSGGASENAVHSGPAGGLGGRIDAVGTTPPPGPGSSSWPPDGGELGALLRGLDWTRTRLGPPATWPQSLRTMLGVVLGSRFPMLLWWGPDLLQLYNDAFRPILRDRHPRGLAAPAAEVWAEVWSLAAPMIERVRGGGPATLIEDRQLFIRANGIVEETYLTVSYGPVPDDDGRVGGILQTAQETTAKVQADRALRLLDELSTRAVGAATEADALRIAAEVLGAAELDLPFALIYDDRGALIASAGWRGATPPPAAVSLDDAAAAWPLAEAARTGAPVVVDDLAARAGAFAAGTWGGVVERAVVLPFARTGGFLIAGASPHRQLDERYRRCLDSVAERVAELAHAARLREAADRRAAALAEQRDVLDRFFRLSLDMMCIAGPDGCFRTVSPAFAVLGYSDGELTSRPFVDFVHPDDVAATLAEVEKLARGERTLHFENRYRCKDGTYRWLAWTSAPDETGTLYAIARDITEERHIRDVIAKARDDAEAANRELEAFSYSVAHDLRGPLRSIDGFSQALLEDYSEQLDADGKRYLGFVRESAQHMAQLIDDLLALSRVTRSEMIRTDVDLSALARAAVARLQRREPGRAIEVVIEDGHRAHGDPRLLAVVFENLIGNAWKFTGRTSGARLEFGATTAEGQRAFHVRDNGAGFDMAFVDKLFGVFQRLHAASEFEGAGVGLATVLRVVHRHGGRVWAEGAVDRGATFYFTLPPATGPAGASLPAEGGRA